MLWDTGSNVSRAEIDVRVAHFLGLLSVALSLVWPGFSPCTNAAPAAMTVQTTNVSFEPEIHFNPDSPQSFMWSWSDGSTNADYPIATNNLGPGQQSLYLGLGPSSPLTNINLGFDGSDGGWTNRYSLRDPQGVVSVNFGYPLTNLQLFAASYNLITNTVDFSGFNALENVEFFHSTNLAVIVTNLPSLRRVCFEACQLQELDLSGCTNLEDVRGAVNLYSEVKITPDVGPKIWHWCFRDNVNMQQQFMDILTNFYSLQEPWFWHANQQGALTFVSSNLTDVEVFGNEYVFADFSNQSNMFECLVNGNFLTNLIVSGCRGLTWLDASENYLPTAVLDKILATLDAQARGLTNLDLSNNAELPSSLGYKHYTNLVHRGAFVNVDWPPRHPAMITNTVQTDPPGLQFSVDGVVYSRPTAFRWRAGTTHAIATVTPQTAGTGTRFVWTGWNDAGSVSHLVAPTGSSTYVAQFKKQYYLTMKAGTGGTATPSSGWRDADSNLNLRATPHTNHYFRKWIGTGPGSVSGVDAVTNTLMSGPISETAAFGVSMDVPDLTLSGLGTLSPDLRGQALQCGVAYTITALPGTGFLFSNWTGGVIPANGILTNKPTLTFLMQSNLALRANFVTNFFIPNKGNYNGIFSDAATTNPASSGSLTISVTDQGAFSGAIVAGGVTNGLSGQFDLSGHAVKQVGPASADPTKLYLTLDPNAAPGQMTGSVSNSHWNASLRAVRAGFNAVSNPATNFARRYTVAVPGVEGDASLPAGYGYATVYVDLGGKATLVGKLAEGTTWSEAVLISATGEWPIYVSLYGKKGMVLGWMNLETNGVNGCDGQLSWVKPPMPGAANYASGFVRTGIAASGSVWQARAPAFASTNGLAIFSGGGLTNAFTNTFQLRADNTITNTSLNALALTNNATFGSFTGAVTPPDASGPGFSLQGVLLQDHLAGYAWFTNQGTSGKVEIRMSP
jgi:hypothetical protein